MYRELDLMFTKFIRPISTEVFEQVDIKSVLCLGNAKQDAIDALSAWGANFQRHHCGYNRGEVVNPR